MFNYISLQINVGNLKPNIEIMFNINFNRIITLSGNTINVHQAYVKVKLLEIRLENLGISKSP